MSCSSFVSGVARVLLLPDVLDRCTIYEVTGPLKLGAHLVDGPPYRTSPHAKDNIGVKCAAKGYRGTPRYLRGSRYDRRQTRPLSTFL